MQKAWKYIGADMKDNNNIIEWWCFGFGQGIFTEKAHQVTPKYAKTFKMPSRICRNTKGAWNYIMIL